MFFINALHITLGYITFRRALQENSLYNSHYIPMQQAFYIEVGFMIY